MRASDRDHWHLLVHPRAEIQVKHKKPPQPPHTRSQRCGSLPLNSQCVEPGSGRVVVHFDAPPCDCAHGCLSHRHSDGFGCRDEVFTDAECDPAAPATFTGSAPLPALRACWVLSSRVVVCACGCLCGGVPDTSSASVIPMRTTPPSFSSMNAATTPRREPPNEWCGDLAPVHSFSPCTPPRPSACMSVFLSLPQDSSLPPLPFAPSLFSHAWLFRASTWCAPTHCAAPARYPRPAHSPVLLASSWCVCGAFCDSMLLLLLLLLLMMKSYIIIIPECFHGAD